MALKDELLALKPLLGTDSPEFYTKMREIAAKYNSEEDKKAIADFVSERLQNIDRKLDVIEESAIKLQLQEVAEIVSLSYLAKKYFNKSRSWLYQRLNGNLVNGKPARFTKEELQLAKDNRIVIVTGASDDLVELEGAITDEGDCWEGGKIYVKAIPNGGIVHNCERSDVFGFTAKWCEEKDKNGKIISWTYDVPIEHETFVIYEDDEPYCRGFVFRV